MRLCVHTYVYKIRSLLAPQKGALKLCPLQAMTVVGCHYEPFTIVVAKDGISMLGALQSFKM